MYSGALKESGGALPSRLLRAKATDGHYHDLPEATKNKCRGARRIARPDFEAICVSPSRGIPCALTLSLQRPPRIVAIGTAPPSRDRRIATRRRLARRTQADKKTAAAKPRRRCPGPHSEAREPVGDDLREHDLDAPVLRLANSKRGRNARVVHAATGDHHVAARHPHAGQSVRHRIGAPLGKPLVVARRPG